MSSLSLTLTALCMWALCAFVLLRRPRDLVSRAFCYFGVWAAAWALAIAFVVFPRTPVSWLILAGHVGFMAPILATSGLTAFALVFPNSHSAAARRWMWRMYVFGWVWAVLAASPAVFRGALLVPGGPPRPITGPLIIPYLLSAIGCTVGAVAILIRKFRRATAVRERLQLTYMLIAVGFLFAVTILSTVILPQMGITQFGPLAPLSLLVAFAGVTLSITKHRLFHLGVVFRQALIGGTVAVVLATVIFVLLQGTRALLADNPALLTAALVGTAVVAGLLLPLLYRASEYVVDAVFFGGPPTDAATLRRLSRDLTTMLSVQPLADLLVSALGRAMRLRHVTLYLVDRRGGADAASATWNVQAAWPQDHPALPELAPDSPLVQIAHEKLGPLMIDWVAGESGALAEAVREQQARLEADVVVPLVAEGQMLGLLVLSEKFNGDLLSETELGILATVADQASTAMANAMLHEEIVHMKVHLDNVLQGMVSGVIAVDQRGYLTTCNRRAAEMLGRPAEALIGRTDNILPQAIADSLRDARLYGRTVEHQRRELARGDEGTYIIMLRASVLRDSQGHTTGALIVFEDQTERLRLEEGLQRADRLASLGTLAAGLAHEIKNPLVSIRTLAQLLPTKFNDPEFRESFALLAADEVERINDLVEQLLQFARPSPPSPQWMLLRPIIDDVLQLMAAELDSQGVDLDRSGPPEQLWVYADAGQMRQVFLNLFMNALHAMEQAPVRRLTVHLTASVGMDAHLQPTPHWAGTPGEMGPPAGRPGSVTVRVSDTGEGIPEGLAEEIFNPFFTTKAKGSGLGLAVVARIVREHGGTISAESHAPVGACLVVHFPAYVSAPEPAVVS